MGYAAYHARCWAEGQTVEAIEAEIKYLKVPKTRTWNEVGNGHNDYLRLLELKAVIAERQTERNRKPMNWDDLMAVIQKMTPEERRGKVLVFDYNLDKFHEPDLCLEGKPPVHLSIN